MDALFTSARKPERAMNLESLFVKYVPIHRSLADAEDADGANFARKD